MIRSILCLVAALVFATQPVVAQEAADSNFADYSMFVGGSPFGGSLSFAVNQSTKTTYQFTLGGLPGMEMTDQEIGEGTYDIKSNSSWVGGFISHRPIDGAEWFRVMAGLGIGRIQNELTDTDGNVFRADYTETRLVIWALVLVAIQIKAFSGRLISGGYKPAVQWSWALMHKRQKTSLSTGCSVAYCPTYNSMLATVSKKSSLGLTVSSRH